MTMSRPFCGSFFQAANGRLAIPVDLVGKWRAPFYSASTAVGKFTSGLVDFASFGYCATIVKILRVRG